LELLIEQGLDGTAEAISILLNEAMRLERERHLGAGPWELSSVNYLGRFALTH
jgi:hypothetical protein